MCEHVCYRDTRLNIIETKKDDFDQVWSKQVPKTHHKVSSANKNRSLNQGRDGVTKHTVLVCHFCNWTPDDIFKAQQNSSIIYPSRTLTRYKPFNNSFTSTNCKTKSQLRDKNDSHFLNTEVKGLHFKDKYIHNLPPHMLKFANN